MENYPKEEPKTKLKFLEENQPTKYVPIFYSIQKSWLNKNGWKLITAITTIAAVLIAWLK
jgi:hypothetical protein